MNTRSIFSLRNFVVFMIAVLFSLIVSYTAYYIFIIDRLTSNLSLLESPNDSIYIEKAIAHATESFRNSILALTPTFGILLGSFVNLTSKVHARSEQKSFLETGSEAIGKMFYLKK